VFLFFVSVILIVLFSAGNDEQSEKKYGFQKNNTKEVRFNCWVLHPVACVSSNTLIKTTARDKC
jgi:hypothetical protein